MKFDATSGTGVDVYPVGLWRDLRHLRSPARRRVRRLRHALRYPFGQAKAGNWRAVKNYFNGYLAEPYSMPPGVRRCGSGWTRNRALRSWQRECRDHG